MQEFEDNNNTNKLVKIEELRDILLLHLMRFSFKKS